jgi:hypothetical protein
LLIADVSVGGQQEFEACLFRGVQQVSIAERCPLLLRGGSEEMVFEKRADGDWSALVEEDLHRPV